MCCLGKALFIYDSYVTFGGSVDLIIFLDSVYYTLSHINFSDSKYSFFLGRQAEQVPLNKKTMHLSSISLVYSYLLGHIEKHRIQ